jgi:hypothetical protein
MDDQRKQADERDVDQDLQRSHERPAGRSRSGAGHLATTDRNSRVYRQAPVFTVIIISHRALAVRRIYPNALLAAD